MAYDAVVVGAGPNGLAAGIELARNGLSVLIREANSTIGGAARTEELTLPGFLHDVGSAVYPLGIGSPYFSSLPLREHGLDWIHPPVPLAHVLDGGRAVLLQRDLDATADHLGEDGRRARGLPARETPGAVAGAGLSPSPARAVDEEDARWRRAAARERGS